MRIPDRYLEHRVTLRPIRPVPSSSGARYYPDRRNVMALVADRMSEVVDGRSDSPTAGQALTSSCHIVMHPESWIPPGSLIIVHAGKPWERTVEVVASQIAEHREAPSSAQVWTV